MTDDEFLDAVAILSEGFCPFCRTEFKDRGKGERVCARGWTYERAALEIRRRRPRTGTVQRTP